MLTDRSAPTRQGHPERFWLPATAFVVGIGVGLLQPLIQVGIGVGLYAGPTYVGLLFLLCIVLALLFGVIAIFARGSRPASALLAAVCACLAVGMIGGNALAARLHVSFRTPPPPFEIHPTGAGWSATGDMIEARSSHTATLLGDGRVLVAGGTTGEHVTSSAELYDPGSGSWTETGSMLSGLSGHMSIRLLDGRVLVTTWGGQCELYDPVTGTWSDTGSMLVPRSAYAMSLLLNGRVLVSGGRSSAIAGDGMAPPELFDPVAGTWASAGAMVVPRAGHTSTLLADGRVLIAGGQGADGTTTDPPGFLASAELYDPIAGTWTTTGPMLEPRSGHAASLVDDGRVLVAGGGVLAGSTTELYDVRTGTWQLGPLVEGWMNPAAIGLGDGRALVIDGMGSIAMYDPARSPSGPIASAAHGFQSTATLLPSGKVLFAGGTIPEYPGPSHTLAFAHLYDPD